MKYRLLDFLVCPDCHNDFELTIRKITVFSCEIDPLKPERMFCVNFCAFASEKVMDLKAMPNCRACFQKEISEGELKCEKCNKSYSIINGIPRILPAENQDDGSSQVRNRFEFQWELWGKEEKIFGRAQGENTDYILKGHSLLTPAYFKGKTVLDGGCGHGRYLDSFASMGAEVIGVDFGNGIEVARDFNQNNAFVYVVQADLLRLPIRSECIDFTFSTGVIHHTPKPRQAFRNLALTAKKGGMLFVWVYPKGSLIWEITQRIIRAITTRLHPRMLFYLCFIPVPLLSFVKTYSSTSLKKASWRQCTQVVYDWYSPKYQFHYSEEELETWFQSEGFDCLARFFVKTGIAGVKKVSH